MINWDRPHREAVAAYAEEAKRRQRIGGQAREDAERLGRKASKDGRPATEEVADQTVYMYVDGLMVGHWPSTTMWAPLDEPEGTGYQVILFNERTREPMMGPRYSAKDLKGHQVFIGRGHQGE